MALTPSQRDAVDTLVDYLTRTVRAGHANPVCHHDAHRALVLLAVSAGHDGHDADARLAASWRDQLNVQAELDSAQRRLAELEDQFQARAADELTHMDQWMEENDALRKRVADLEGERGRADARLRVERCRLQTRNSEARSLADGWRTYTLQQRGEDGEWITMREAFGAILAALDGDTGESDDETGAEA